MKVPKGKLLVNGNEYAEINAIEIDSRKCSFAIHSFDSRLVRELLTIELTEGAKLNFTYTGMDGDLEHTRVKGRLM